MKFKSLLSSKIETEYILKKQHLEDLIRSENLFDEKRKGFEL
jgi:hypothetical protein